MRLPYYDPDTAKPDQEAQEAIDHIAARRPGGQLLELDKALLHSPPMALGWSNLVGNIRDKSVLPSDVRELIMCRVAVLNGSRYEWEQHMPLMVKAVQKLPDMTDSVVNALVDVVENMKPGSCLKGAFDQKFPKAVAERWRVVIRFTDAATTLRNPDWDDLWTDLGNVLRIGKGYEGGERAAVEFVTCIGAYNMVSRFLVALDVGEVGSWCPGALDP